MASARTWGAILRIISIILGPLLKAISPIIKDALEDGMVKLMIKARGTENPIDDLFMEFVFRILNLDIPPEA